MSDFNMPVNVFAITIVSYQPILQMFSGYIYMKNILHECQLVLVILNK